MIMIQVTDDLTINMDQVTYVEVPPLGDRYIVHFANTARQVPLKDIHNVHMLVIDYDWPEIK